jgi:uncharacterized membrane protein YphA (DoxX/SURF4 family)
MARPPTPTPIGVAAKVFGRALIASVFLVAGAMKLSEAAAALSASASAPQTAKGAPPPPALATIAYASRRLDLFLASSLGAPASLLAALRPHHAILVALVGLGEVVAAAGLVIGLPWAAPALLALLSLVTPVVHCFWLLSGSPSAAGLELGHFVKNVAIAGGLVLEWVAVSTGAGAERGSAAAGLTTVRGGGKVVAGGERGRSSSSGGGTVGKDE